MSELDKQDALYEAILNKAYSLDMSYSSLLGVLGLLEAVVKNEYIKDDCDE